MKRYAVKELFLTVQGEGYNTGRRAVFVRFAGCNLWSGKERIRPACAQWCDTDFVGTDGPGGGRYSAEGLAEAIRAEWGPGRPFVVWTGGEPTLQWDGALGQACALFENAVETNGTLGDPLPRMDWITVSPKGAYPLARTTGSELKLVYPQPEAEAAPEWFEGRADLNFEHYFLSPLQPQSGDRTRWTENMQLTVAYVFANPFWRLSLQTHKWLGVP